MKPECTKPGHRLFCAAVTAALAVSLAACGQKPAAAPATAKIESAADAAAHQAKQAAAEQKKTGAQNAQAGAAKQAADKKAAADSALASKVKSALAATPDLKYLGLDVNALDGNVTLFGTADYDAQRHEAQKVAAGVPGVKSVKNALQIVRGS